MRALMHVPLLLSLLVHTGVGFAQEKHDNESLVTLNYRDTDIVAVAQSINDLTGTTFIVAPSARGKLTVISASPVERDRALEIFYTALRLAGFAAVTTADGSVMILPAGRAKGAGSPVVSRYLGEAENRIVTRVYRLYHVEAGKVATEIKAILGSDSVVAALTSGNALIISDYAQSQRRIERILKSVDRPVGGSISVIELKHISPKDVIQAYESVYLNSPTTGGSGGAGSSGKGSGLLRRFTISPDPRGGRLIIRSNSDLALKNLQALVALLDTPSEKSMVTRIVSLNYTEAKEVAQALNSIVSDTGFKNSTGSITVDVKRKNDNNSGRHNPGRRNFRPNRKDDDQKISVRPFESTRKLIITAPEEVFNRLQGVISELDVRQRQVYVEALVAEVLTSKVGEFGIQWQSLRGMEEGRAPSPEVVGSVSLGPAGGSIGEVSSTGGLGSGMSIGIVSGAITLANGVKITNMLALVKALEASSQANILSTPILLALDNEESEIIVGQNVPLITGSYAPTTGGSAGPVNPFQTIERKDVGLKLRIKPFITDTGTIRLEIYQEVSSLQATTVQTGASDVITNKRSLDSTVLVEDGQIITLGGLVQDDVSVTINKAPFLGDLPLIGHLFRYETRKRIKTNLMVFLRPLIVREPADSLFLTRNRYDYIVDEQGSVEPSRHVFLPDMEAPKLGEFKGKTTFEDFVPPTPPESFTGEKQE